MALRTQCHFCGNMTIPRRLLAFYVGSSDSLKVWECRECDSLWSEKLGEQELVV